MKKVLFFLTLTILQQFSYSYEFTNDFTNGLFWKNLPLDFNISEFDSVKKEALSELVKSAADIWEEGVDEDIWEFEKELSGRNIIRWAENFEAETGFDPDSTLAVTIRHNAVPYWGKAEIILNPNKQLLLLNPLALKFVLMHELGHTMGLGHSEDENSVMAASFDGDTSLIENYVLASDDYDGMSSAMKLMKERSSSPAIIQAASAESESKNGLSCGTIDLDSGNGPGGPLQFIFSLFLGALMLLMGTKQRLLPNRILR